MKENKLLELAKQFAVEVVDFYGKQEDKKWHVLYNQFLKSGTSIGANIHEANYAASKLDFINKLQIALKECYETEYWLTLLKESKSLSEKGYKEKLETCNKLRNLLIASIKTAKSNI